MKKNIFIFVLSIFTFSGCASTVVTYDRAGKITGTCKAFKGFIVGGKASCYGYANDDVMTRKKLPEIPDSAKIYLNKF